MCLHYVLQKSSLEGACIIQVAFRGGRDDVWVKGIIVPTLELLYTTQVARKSLDKYIPLSLNTQAADTAKHNNLEKNIGL